MERAWKNTGPTSGGSLHIPAKEIRLRFFLGKNTAGAFMTRRLVVLLFACPNEIAPPVLLPAHLAAFRTDRFFLAVA